MRLASAKRVLSISPVKEPYCASSDSDCARQVYNTLLRGAHSAAHLSVLPPGLDLGGKKPRAHWNAVALAFLGDSIWEVTGTPAQTCLRCKPDHLPAHMPRHMWVCSFMQGDGTLLRHGA